MSRLALHGGEPVIGDGNALPSLFPRVIAPRAYDYIREVLDSGFLPIRGMASRFERRFAEEHGTAHALSASNCTSAIHIALAALGVGVGDEVVVTSVSDYGSLAGILAQRAVPVFCDIDPDTGNMDAPRISRCLTEKTRAIVVVHWQGLICDMDPILEVARARGIPVVEDCCQCPLGEYKGRKAGTFGDIGCFSFDAEKHLSTEHGGMLIMQDPDLYDRAFKFSINRGGYHVEGFGRKYDMFGYNYRYGDMEAALGLAQLDILPEQNARRVELAARLSERLATIDGVLPLRIPDGSSCLYWIYPVFFEMDRFEADIRTIGEAIEAEGIGGASHVPYYFFPDSVEYLPWDRMTFRREEMTGALSYVSRTIRWVWHDKYSDADIENMYLAIKKVADYFRR
ncbi:DegT/DnrJ/EryC1/StrS family aminotransferase [Paenibacillus sp. HJGM_3]|uniref:DegT/DnrJ/EryC1/StrS family aminotransferase n=1 Tax=Paenibacillus sp. HJGM_3 TaxID=3379816 RepID=UPI00385E0511